ncbi:MAG: hypothetical protein HJJLKODD_00834 [Phycisphaerae bacterium]|nr:hypothetical protein [Phycisphaerae bacterium]
MITLLINFSLLVLLRSNAEPPASAPATQPVSVSLRLVTYNIEHPTDLESTHQISELLQQEQPDIICLQEVTWPKKPDQPGLHQAQYLADRLHMTWSAVRRGSLDNEDYGMAILIRGQILDRHALKIPNERPYGLLMHVIIDQRPYTVVSIHARSLDAATPAGFLNTEPIRVEQIRHLIDTLKNNTDPIIIAGDFNTLPGSASYQLLADQFRDPASGPDANASTRETHGWPCRIDFVWLPHTAQIDNYRVAKVDYSDHRPVVVDFTLPPPQATSVPAP